MNTFQARSASERLFGHLKGGPGTSGILTVLLLVPPLPHFS